jgi:peptidoglycan/xylan/chitin deacetylase (PgdA/CDA1 family)
MRRHDRQECASAVQPGARFGPGRHPGALVLTFDNLGEASELEHGTWPADKSLGQHPSVTAVLPRLLDELDANALTATFFLEGINCELYPAALLEIVGRGHELGHHGWRHEPWAELSREHEQQALARGISAFSSLGLEVRGFRPPGGGLTVSSPTLLRDAGIYWCSPAEGSYEICDGLAYVPFEWRLVDAYHLMARFEGLRVRRGDDADVVAPGKLVDRLAEELDALAVRGGARTLVLHPFLMLDDGWFVGVGQLLALIRELALAGRIWVVPGARFAGWLHMLACESRSNPNHM